MGVPLRLVLPAGLATVVGSLPQLTPFDASRVVRELTPGLPSGPSLRLDSAADLDDAERGAGVDGSAERLAPLRAFLDDLRGRVEPVVVSVTGPVTVELGLMQRGVDRDRASGAAARYVQDWARAVIDLTGQLLPGAPLLLFLEEPGLANSMHPTFPLSPDEIEGLVSEVVEPLSEDALVGVQVSGRADWAMLLRTGIAVLGAPISARLDTAAAELGRFLDGGGFVAWGAVPVDEPLGSGVERLWRRLSALWADLAQAGLDPLLLRERSIITPSAGLGSFGISQAERVLRLTGELSERVFNQVVGARLPVGA
ncbi:MAG: hypothetical protein K1X38_13640 [Microthrixaceae bacterium]|nr:hypothetical protein [Microthrixaceae bacterium]